MALVSRTAVQLEGSKQAALAIDSDCIVHLYPVDVSSPEQVLNMMDVVVGKFGRIDVVLANAGVMGEETKFCDIDVSSWWGVYVQAGALDFGSFLSNYLQETNAQGALIIC